MKVMYVGERVSQMGKVYQLFKNKRGKTFPFSGLRYALLGHCYEMAKDQTLKTNLSAAGVEGWEMTEAEHIECEAQKQVVKTHRLKKRKAMELKKPHTDIVRAICLLRPFVRSLDLWDQKRFMDYIANACSKRK